MQDRDTQGSHFSVTLEFLDSVVQIVKKVVGPQLAR